MHSKVRAPVLDTAGLYKLLEYNYIIFPLTLTATYLGLHSLARWTGYEKRIVSDGHKWDWTTIIYFILNLLFVLAQTPPYASILGLCLPMRPKRYAQAPKRRTYRSLRICLVTKGTNFQTVINSCRPWASLQKCARVRFSVVLDDDNEGKFRDSLPPYVQLTLVPKSFVAQHAKHKARALEYFRQQQHLTKEDWVLHLDEESLIDEHVIGECLNFIERGDEDIAMSTIHYSSANHWKNPFLSAAEVSRVAEDFGRFQLPTRLMRRPLLGWMHGSGILINGAVENRVTWETACVAEDFWFAYKAVDLGYNFGWLHTVIREQPPESMNDFYRQRRRWYTGILSIRSMVVWTVLILSVSGTLGFFIAPIYSLFGGSILIPQWLYLWLLFNFACEAHTMLVSSAMQDLLTPDMSWMSLAENACKSALLSPVVHLLEVSALVSCLFAPSKGFAIINKS